MTGWTTNNWIQVIIYLVTFAVAFGGLRAKTEAMGQKFSDDVSNLKDMINRLEQKQDEHNGFMRRMAVVENIANNNKGTCDKIADQLLQLATNVTDIKANVKSNQHRIDDLEK